ARSLRIDFPSKSIYYPLRPTRVYSNEIRTAIYMRGLVQPGEGPQPAGLRCVYVMGKVSTEDTDNPKRLMAEPLTPVEFSSNPSDWTADLVLEAGAPTAVHIAYAIDEIAFVFPWLVRIVTGALLASFLPWVVVPRAQRRTRDWLWAAGVGAVICMTILAS